MQLLTTGQKLALGFKRVVPDIMTDTRDVDINAAFFRLNGIGAVNIRAACVTPIALRHRGVEDATALRTLGFDAIDLNDAAFCSSCISAFGTDDVTRSFMLTAGDAVAIAGSTAVVQLGITTQRLLELCAGAPIQAKAVIQQLEPRGGALRGVSMTTLLDSGLRAQTLCNMGYGADALTTQTTGCTAKQLSVLGFTT
jgi:hypothetical protein